MLTQEHPKSDTGARGGRYRYFYRCRNTPRRRVRPVWREEVSRVCSKYELTICYGTAFLWHFNLLILLAERHLPASASRNHGASASPPASYYRNCLARTLYSLVCNSNNFQPPNCLYNFNSLLLRCKRDTWKCEIFRRMIYMFLM